MLLVFTLQSTLCDDGKLFVSFLYKRRQEVAGPNLQLVQYSFRGLMIVPATGFTPLSHRCPLLQRLLCGKAATDLERLLCRVLVEGARESIDSCNSLRDITEIT